MKPSSPETQLTQITEKHIAVRNWMAWGGIAPFTISECERLNAETESLLRSLVGPEATHVLVSRRELEHWRTLAHIFDADGLVKGINRWLSVSTPAPQDFARGGIYDTPQMQRALAEDQAKLEALGAFGADSPAPQKCPECNAGWVLSRTGLESCCDVCKGTGRSPAPQEAEK